MGPRRKLQIAVLALCLAAAAALGCGADPDPTTEPVPPQGGFDERRAFRDLREQVELGPRPAGSAASRTLTRRLVGELEAAGVEDVRIQRPERNVVGSIPGSEPGFVVLGAHHDTKDLPGFVGANDGASGVAVLLELARSLPRPLPGPSIAVAIFDAEEARGDRSFERDGTRGSRQYVSYAKRGGVQGSPPLGEIDAMVLLDLVGDCELQIPRESNSDPGLYDLFAAASDGAPFEGAIGPIGDDHVPFLEAGVPAVDLIDFNFGPGGTPGAFWHTEEDSLDKVCPESLDAVGEAALLAIPEIR